MNDPADHDSAGNDPAGHDSAGNDPALTSARNTYAPTGEEPQAGTAPMGPADPTERTDAGLDDLAQVERDSAFYGAGDAVAEAPQTPPFSSARYPASSEATGMTVSGDEVTGIEDGPTEGLADQTR